VLRIASYDASPGTDFQNNANSMIQIDTDWTKVKRRTWSRTNDRVKNTNKSIKGRLEQKLTLK
jgi:hypothetical protein